MTRPLAALALDWAAELWPPVDYEFDRIEVHDGTLSELIARAARVDTTAGKFAFTGALAFGSLLFWIHIVRFEYGMKAARR